MPEIIERAAKMADWLRGTYGFSPEMNAKCVQLLKDMVEEMERLKAERDALKADMLLAEADNNFCQICAHLGCGDKTLCIDRTEYDCFEWRGVRTNG